MLQDRISSTRKRIAEFDVDVFLVSSLPNIRYLSGFTGSDGVLLVGRNNVWFLTDSRYTTQAGEEVSGAGIVEYRSKLDGIVAQLKSIGAAKVGLEAVHTTIEMYNKFTELLPGIELIPIGEEVDELRGVKDIEEIICLSNTAMLASTAFMDILSQIRPGIKEREVALALEFAMKKAGAEEKAFDFIVASGLRGALPHGKASDKLIQDGELVTVDFGAVYDGYFSDETVTVAVGSADLRQREIYGVVKEAHDRALDAVKPGVSVKDLDAIARGFIETKGYGEYFGHGLGHGVGLEVHEKPVVSKRSETVVEEGMVFTVEPGIYIPGWGGVRIEDTVVVTASGYQLLTMVSKELMIV